MIIVVDYGRGNLFSISQALNVLGAEHRISADPEVIERADRILLPGVGAFGDAMAALNQARIVEPLRAAATAGTPILGICLGMQLLADKSEEFGAHRGLGLIPGVVKRLPQGAMRVPNVGWRCLEWRDDERRSRTGLSKEAMVYFVHSFGFDAADPSHVVASINFNGAAPVAIVQCGSVVGMQFHPEKSADAGLALMKWFLGMKPSTLAA